MNICGVEHVFQLQLLTYVEWVGGPSIDMYVYVGWVGRPSVVMFIFEVSGRDLTQ